MPKIGMRMCKSAIAVLCCLFISLFRANEGIVFYSCIAAVLCIQQDISGSKKVGFNRLKGTCIGGIIGMIFLYMEAFLEIDLLLSRYLLIAFFIIVVIYISVCLKMSQASYIACVVFLSISITHASDVNALLFASNRMLDTFIGIFVALLINGIHIPHWQHSHSLFAIQMDLEIDAYSLVKLRQLDEQGANVCVNYCRGIGSLKAQLAELTLHMHALLLEDTVLFDMRTKKYVHKETIDAAILERIYRVCKEVSCHCFSYAIIHHVLHVYYDTLDNPMQEKMYEEQYLLAMQNYVCGKVPSLDEVILVQFCERREKIQEIVKVLKKRKYLNTIAFRIEKHEGEWESLFIKSKRADFDEQCDWLLQNQKFQRVYNFSQANLRSLMRLYHQILPHKK